MSSACSRIYCNAYMSMYAYTFTARLHIEMGPAQTSEFRRQGTVSCKLMYPDHFWQPGPILAAKSGPGSDHFLV